MTKNSESPPPAKRRRWLYVLLTLLVVLAGSLWGAFEWATAKAEKVLNERLAERSLYLSYGSRSWVPWRGLSLNDVALFQDEARTRPLLALSRLDVDFPWREIARTREFLSRWRLHGATLSLHDAKGKIVMEHVTVDAVVRSGEIEFSTLQVQTGPRVFDLSGRLLLRSEEEVKTPRAFVPDLDAMRAIIATLDFKPGTGPFVTKGAIQLDARQTPLAWSADLHGEGTSLVWQGQPLKAAKVDTLLNNAGLKGSVLLRFHRGQAEFEMSLPAWGGAPLALKGKIADSGGRTDAFGASYEGANRTIAVHELQGNADLFEFLGNIPEVVPQLPTFIRTRVHPDILVKDFVWNGNSNTWSMQSLLFRKPADVVLKIEGHDVEVKQLKVAAACDRGRWTLSDVSASTLGGTMKLSGVFEGSTLRQASLSVNGLLMSHLSPWLDGGQGSFGKASITLSYAGSLGSEPQQLTGSGTINIDNAPMVHVPLLDEVYALFDALVPGVKRDGTGGMRGKFSARDGVFSFSSFEASGGSVTVTATGVIDLPNRTVNGRARGRLQGVGGLVTGPVGRLLEMQVSGPLDDIRVRPVGPVRVVAGAVGKATDVVIDAGKASTSIVKEGIKLPFKALGVFGRKKKN